MGSDTYILRQGSPNNGIQLGGTAITPGSIVGMGQSTAGLREKIATADKNHMSFYLENSAASGDNRGMYLRLYFTTAGGGGEAARIFTTVEDVAAATAHGAHISLNFGDTGSITGLGVAMRATLHVPNQAQSAGTYAAIEAELWHDGSSSDITGATAYGAFRVSVAGNATGAAKAINFMTISAPVGTGKFVDTNITSGTGYAALRVLVEGVGVKVLLLYTP